MSWGSPAFVIAVIAMSYAAWLITSWIRAKHGYPIENEWGGMTETSERSDAGRQIELLSNENEGLKGQVSRREERIAVLEGNTTGPPSRTARATNEGVRAGDECANKG